MLIVLGFVTLMVNIAIVVPLERHAAEVSSIGGREAIPAKNQNERGLDHNHDLDHRFDTSQGQQQHQVKNPQMEEDKGQQYIRSIFEEAEVELTNEMIEQLPSWRQVQQVIGEHPYIFGLDKCAEYREKVPAVERMLGSSGKYNWIVCQRE